MIVYGICPRCLTVSRYLECRRCAKDGYAVGVETRQSRFLDGYLWHYGHTRDEAITALDAHEASVASNRARKGA